MKMPKDRDTRSKDEIQRQKDVAREEAGRRDTQQLLKQMLGLEGSRGQDENFRLRHTYCFWPTERQERVHRHMLEGLSLTDAVKKEIKLHGE